MDTHEEFYWIQCSRLRTNRHKKRKQREDADKQLIRKYKEEQAIWLAVRQLGWTELKPPVQRGFIRFFVLRPDVAHTKEAPFYQKILDKINSKQWSHRKDFKKKRSRFGKKIYVVREQKLTDIPEYDFIKKFDEKEKTCFYETLVHFGKSKTPCRVYRFLEPWRFILRVQPNMITKVRIKNLDLEKQQAELDKFFQVNNRRFRLWKLLYGSDRWGWDLLHNPKYDNPLKNKPLSVILEEHWPDQSFTAKTKTLSKTEGFCFYASYFITHQNLTSIQDHLATNTFRLLHPLITKYFPDGYRI
jgi:hypothetical protein